ncbi:unnamed protein product [Trichogramma brassicae]|uniref:Uncharacterized protein n=1 Tax=Trichogramma brassicae TaxID=86971 RepID=A0A6H5I2Q5_9HYME|nr:unnamed protein product [Trichogramma brassicae]
MTAKDDLSRPPRFPGYHSNAQRYQKRRGARVTPDPMPVKPRIRGRPSARASRRQRVAAPNRAATTGADRNAGASDGVEGRTQSPRQNGDRAVMSSLLRRRNISLPGGIVRLLLRGRVSGLALQMGFWAVKSEFSTKAQRPSVGQVRAGRVRPVLLMGLWCEMVVGFPTKTCWTSSLSLGESTDRRIESVAYVTVASATLIPLSYFRSKRCGLRSDQAPASLPSCYLPLCSAEIPRPSLPRRQLSNEGGNHSSLRRRRRRTRENFPVRSLVVRVPVHPLPLFSRPRVRVSTWAGLTF